jgi:hypothetical protein
MQQKTGEQDHPQNHIISGAAKLPALSGNNCG